MHDCSSPQVPWDAREVRFGRSFFQRRKTRSGAAQSKPITKSLGGLADPFLLIGCFLGSSIPPPLATAPFPRGWSDDFKTIHHSARPPGARDSAIPSHIVVGGSKCVVSGHVHPVRRPALKPCNPPSPSGRTTPYVSFSPDRSLLTRSSAPRTLVTLDDSLQARARSQGCPASTVRRAVRGAVWDNTSSPQYMRRHPRCASDCLPTDLGCSFHLRALFVLEELKPSRSGLADQPPRGGR